MLKLALIFFGSGLGAIARYKISEFTLHHWIDWRFPLGTFLVNLLGCLFAGILAGLVERQDFFTPDTRMFIFTGLLGGFTTFSAFGLETTFLLRRGDTAIALAYVTLSLLLGMAALWLGVTIVPHRLK